MYFLRVSQKGPASIFVKLSVGPRREVGDGGDGRCLSISVTPLKAIKAKKIKQAFYKAQKEKKVKANHI